MSRLVMCPDCKAEISRTAIACPRCGRPRRRGRFGWIAFAVVAAVVSWNALSRLLAPEAVLEAMPPVAVIPIEPAQAVVAKVEPTPHVPAEPIGLADDFAGAFSAIFAKGKRPEPVADAAPPPGYFKAGDRVILNGVRPGAAVWIAGDDTAYDEMLDAQNADSGALLFRLAKADRISAHPDGARAIVVRTAVFSVLVRVTDSDTAGGEGWVQKERVAPE